MNSVIDQIKHMFKTNTVLSLKKLSEYFPNRSTRSLSRDLNKIGIITSFSHAGQYRILSTAPRFDLTGLWFYQNIGFSKYGTLKSTVIHLVEASDIGHTHKELNQLLKIKTHNTLKELVDSKKLSRHQMPNNFYVYLHKDNKKAETQYDLRLSINIKSLTRISPPSQWATIEILAEVIRCYDVEAEVSFIVQKLNQRGNDIKESTVEYVLTHYQVKKTDLEIAKLILNKVM